MALKNSAAFLICGPFWCSALGGSGDAYGLGSHGERFRLRDHSFAGDRGGCSGNAAIVLASVSRCRLQDRAAEWWAVSRQKR
jgi:hypothetical protein